MTASAHYSALPEYEEELEGEYEGEEFDLGGIVGGLLGESEYEEELEGEYEGEEFDLGGIVGGLLGESEYEEELEGEWEDEYEDEGEALANPLRRVYPDAMMEHLGAAAAEAETEAEAEAFIGALVPLAAGLVRAAAPHVARATPQLVRGLSKVARTLRRNPTTRPLVRTLPTIASRTTRSLARHAAHGRPITPHRAARTLARQTAAVLSKPQTRKQVVHRARAQDRRYHRAIRTGQWWKGTIPSGSATAIRALAPRSVAQGGVAPVSYRTPVRYGAPVRHGAPVRYRTPVRYGAPVRYRTPVRYRAPGGSGTPVSYGAPVRRTPARQVRGRGYPRRQRYPSAPSIAWIPVSAWCGSQPPPGAHPH
jgi:hypothetical protein